MLQTGRAGKSEWSLQRQATKARQYLLHVSLTRGLTMEATYIPNPYSFFWKIKPREKEKIVNQQITFLLASGNSQNLICSNHRLLIWKNSLLFSTLCCLLGQKAHMQQMSICEGSLQDPGLVVSTNPKLLYHELFPIPNRYLYWKTVLKLLDLRYEDPMDSHS